MVTFELENSSFRSSRAISAVMWSMGPRAHPLPISWSSLAVLWTVSSKSHLHLKLQVKTPTLPFIADLLCFEWLQNAPYINSHLNSGWPRPRTTQWSLFFSNSSNNWFPGGCTADIWQCDGKDDRGFQIQPSRPTCCDTKSVSCNLCPVTKEANFSTEPALFQGNRSGHSVRGGALPFTLSLCWLPHPWLGWCPWLWLLEVLAEKQIPQINRVFISLLITFSSEDNFI